jgi:phosphoenolpyruvate synthase/pyruvate phosphate dikinase
LSGTAVGNNIGKGKVKIMYNMDSRDNGDGFENFKKGDILVTDMTDPDWEPIMKLSKPSPLSLLSILYIIFTLPFPILLPTAVPLKMGSILLFLINLYSLILLKFLFEWAVDGLSGDLYIVQARPETIHSRRNLSKIIKMDYVN